MTHFFSQQKILFLFCVLYVAPAMSQEPATPNKKYLPQPILEEHTGWVDLYYRAFDIAFGKVKKGTPQNQFVPAYMDEAFSENIFQWDTTFMTMFGRYSNGQLPSITSLENFYVSQHEDGWISRELREKDGTSYWPKDESHQANCSINPPLFSFAEWLNYQVSGDSQRFLKDIKGKTILQRLVDYFDWIKANRRWENGLYWTTSYANGMDHSPRLAPKDECDHAGGSWIDISAQQALNALYIARIAGAVGNTQIQRRFEQEHSELKALINRELWNKQDGFYYDKNRENQWFKVKTPASFWPMVAEVSDHPRNRRMIEEHLLNPREFWTLHHLPSVATNEPGYHADGSYWDGAVWAPTSYQTMLGLASAGEHQLAQRIAANHLEHLYWVYRQTNTLYENYQPEAVAKGVKARPDFVGWTGVIPIAGLIEHILGIEVNAPQDSLTWRLTLSERHGIRQLKFGDNLVDLVAEDRLTADSGARVTVTSDSPFKLIVYLADKPHSYNIHAGKTELQIGNVVPYLHAEGHVHKGMEEQAFGSEQQPAVMQLFTPSQSGSLMGIDIKIRPILLTQYTPDLIASLYELETPQSGLLSLPKKALTQRKIPSQSLANFYQILHLPMDKVAIQAGKTYALVLNPQTPQASAQFAWITGAEVSPSGYFAHQQSSTWTADFTTGDAWMKWYWVTKSYRRQ